MSELHLALSFEAVVALTQGEELVFDVIEDNLRVTLSCDELAARTFRDQINTALLRMLPMGTLPN